MIDIQTIALLAAVISSFEESQRKYVVSDSDSGLSAKAWKRTGHPHLRDWQWHNKSKKAWKIAGRLESQGIK